MKRSKTIFALLLALTLLLGLTPVAFAEPNVTIKSVPEHTIYEGTISYYYDDQKGTYTATFTWKAEDGFEMANPSVTVDSEDGQTVNVQSDVDKHTHTLLDLKESGVYTVSLSTSFNIPIIYDANGGTIPGDDSMQDKATEGDNYNISKKPTRDGYVFAGWKSDYDEKVYQAGDTLKVPSLKDLQDKHDVDNKTPPVTLTAQWVPALTITYEPGATDSVSGMPDSTSNPVTVGAGLTFTTAAAPVRSGHSFQGWRPSWNDELYEAKADVKAPDTDSGTDLTLTAEWKKMSAIPGKPVEGGDSGSGGSSQSYYYIYADCSSGGSVSPSGYTRVSADGSLTVSFAPKSGYSILAVYVDGVKTGTVGGQYTFSKVSADHKIYVQFEKTSEGYDDVPKTGDEAPLAAALGLSALALAGLGCLLVSRRRAMQR